MLHAKFQDHRTFGSGEEIFKGFYHIWVWQPSWSCDLENLYTMHNKFSNCFVWVSPSKPELKFHFLA